MTGEPVYDVAQLISDHISPEARAALETLMGGYEDPSVTRFNGGVNSCDRCAAVVSDDLEQWAAHCLWHRNLTYSQKLLQAFVLQHLTEHRDVNGDGR